MQPDNGSTKVNRTEKVGYTLDKCIVVARYCFSWDQFSIPFTSLLEVLIGSMRFTSLAPRRNYWYLSLYVELITDLLISMIPPIGNHCVGNHLTQKFSRPSMVADLSGVLGKNSRVAEPIYNSMNLVIA